MMWPYYGDGWSWIWMSGMTLLFWGAIIFAAVWALRVATRPKSGDDATDVLRKRLASGEITQDEFERTRRALQN